jgi:hypothetical protein
MEVLHIIAGQRSLIVTITPVEMRMEIGGIWFWRVLDSRATGGWK